jgi:adenylate cyclase
MRARSIPYYRLLAGSLLAIFVFLKILNPPIIEWFGFLAFDTYQQISPREKKVRPVTILDVDERSLNEVGQWPWPRTVIADIVTQLFELGAVAVGFDVIFSEPDRLSPALLVKNIKDLDPETRGKLSNLPSNDEVLAATIKRWRVVVAESGLAAAVKSLTDNREDAVVAIIGPDPPFFEFPGRLRTLPIIEQAAAGSGLITVIPERDDVVRRIPVILRAGGALKLSMAVEMLRVVSGTSGPIVKSSENGIEEIDLRGLKIPTDRNGRLWPHFSRFDPGQYVSAVDVLNQLAPSDKIRGKLVIFGSSALSMNDLRRTPVGLSPGAAIHAEVIENILTKSMLTRPSYIVALEIISIIIIGSVFSFLMPLLSARILATASILTLILVIGSSWAAFRYWKLLIDPIYPLITVAILVMVLTFYIYRYSESQRGSIRSFFELHAKK